jgi:hypothetical protein
MKELQEWIFHLDSLRSFLECGFTFQEALHLHQPRRKLRMPPELAEDWLRLRKQIQSGEAAGSQLLGTFISKLEFQLEMAESLKRATAMPIAQCVVCLVIFVMTLLFRVGLFSSGWTTVDGVAALFLTFAVLLQSALLRHFLKDRWFGEWLQFLQNLEMRIRNGKTPQGSLQELNQHNSAQRIPIELRKPCLPSSRKEALYEEAFSAWEQIWSAFERGGSIGKILEAQRRRLGRLWRERQQQKTLRLSFLSLIPLYFFFLPACLLVLLGPLLAQLLQM